MITSRFIEDLMGKLKLFIMKKKMSIIFMITLEQSIIFLPPFFFILLLYFLFFHCKNKSCSSAMGVNLGLCQEFVFKKYHGEETGEVAQ